MADLPTVTLSVGTRVRGLWAVNAAVWAVTHLRLPVRAAVFLVRLAVRRCRVRMRVPGGTWIDTGVRWEVTYDHDGPEVTRG